MISHEQATENRDEEANALSKHTANPSDKVKEVKINTYKQTETDPPNYQSPIQVSLADSSRP